MKRFVSTTITLMATIAVLAVPAAAQEAPGSGGAMAVPYGESPPQAPPYFVYNGDGTVTIDGDTGSSCRDFAVAYEEGYYRQGDQGLAQSVLEQCEQDGALSSGSVTPPTVQARQYQQAPQSSVELPSTGGPNLPLAAIAAGTALLSLGGTVKSSRR